MQKAAHQTYTFGEFRLDLTRGCLYRGVEELKLRPKSFDVLKYFAENSGRLIGKNELIEAVWRETAVTDDSLVQCLKDIRNALGDKSRAIIRTVPRRGYVFESEVNDGDPSLIYLKEVSGLHLVIEEVESRQENTVDIPLSGRASNIVRKGTMIPILLAGTAALAAAVMLLGAWQYNVITRGFGVGMFRDVEVKGISHVGNIVNSAIAPDGKTIVYSTSDAGRESIWIRQVSTDSTKRIIEPTELRYFGVSFSPDGEYIYYLRSDRANPFPRTLYRIPKLGGVTEKILADMDWCPTFSPDGGQIAFVRNSVDKDISVLMTANADGTGEREIAVRPLKSAYSYPAWSPDGQTLAVTVGSAELGDSFRDLVTVNIADGTQKTLTARSWYWITQSAWLADGSGLVMSANPNKSYQYDQLWLVSYPDGGVRQITNDSNNYNYLSMTADSRTLLAGNTKLLTHVWLVPEGDAALATRLTSGLGDHKHVRWTPGGKLSVAAFDNNNIDIFLRDPGSDETVPLTANAGTNWGQEPSPDGRYLVFDSDRTGDFHIWRIGSDGGDPLQLTHGSGEKFAEISPDGKWVVYTAFQDWTLWKVSIDGGEPVKIAETYARQSAISPDGKWIVYMASESNRFVIMPFEGKGDKKTIDLPADAPFMQPVQWSPDGGSLQYIVKRGGVENIWQQPLDGGPSRQITNFTSERIFSYDWSDDAKTLAAIRGAWTADLVLVTQR